MCVDMEWPDLQRREFLCCDGQLAQLISGNYEIRQKAL